MPVARFAVAATIAVGVSACSNAGLSDNGPRKPSMRVAAAALSSGAPDLALRVAEITLHGDPRNVPALIAKGDALYALGQNKAAQEAYKSAIDLDPTAAAAQLGFGRTLVQSDPVGAESAFLAALRADTTSVAALNDLGIARDMQGHVSEAQDAYHLALSIAPDSPDVKVNLGKSLVLAGHNADAAAVLGEVAADPQAAQQYHKELAAALTAAGAQTTVKQASDSTRGDPGRPRLPQPEQAATVSPLRTAELTPPAPLTAPIQPVVERPLPTPNGDMAEATAAVRPLPDMSLTSERQPKPMQSNDRSEPQPYVQLASVLSEQDAVFEWRRVTKKMPQILGGRELAVSPADVDGKTWWGIRTFGFVSWQDAKNFCASLMDAGWKCRTGRGS